MPPSKSGIADYSSALVAEISKRADVEVFDREGKPFNQKLFDIALYHLGNNPYHDFVYETALRNPGVVVMHEANLHHLIAHVTINRGNWDAYVAECEYNGGSVALQYAERVRRLEVGPDYEGLAMTKRLLDVSRGVVVHSDFVARETRAQGFDGPIATIPHGASIPKTNRNATRHLLGIEEGVRLVGAFGHLKPYKRIAESLRAFKRLVRLDPRVRMILAGEPHPDFPVARIIRTLGLDEYVRILGFVPIEKFVDYMDACDIILNLRFPTVGETSGSLQRALGLGKPVIVTDIGSFAELPNDICLKVSVGKDEEDLIFEYLNTLVTRPDLAQAMGGRARDWIARECNWGVVAERYVSFLRRCAWGEGLDEQAAGAVAGSAEPFSIGNAAAGEAPLDQQVFVQVPRELGTSGQVEQPGIEMEAIEEWLTPEGKDYAAHHKSRFVQTLEITPPGDPTKSVLEMGAYMQMTPALRFQLGYGYVRGCYYGEPGRIDHKVVTSDSGQIFECDIDHFDAEKHQFPYEEESFDTVMCCELLEHLFSDPMHMMSEINRILKPGGHLVMTTPNIGSLRAISSILLGYHPAFFPAYIRPPKEGEEPEARHNREYVPMEIQHLLEDSGFEMTRLETGEFREEPHPEFGWVLHLLERYKLSHNLRGDGIYAVGRKQGPVRNRWPEWLYS